MTGFYKKKTRGRPASKLTKEVTILILRLIVERPSSGPQKLRDSLCKIDQTTGDCLEVSRTHIYNYISNNRLGTYRERLEYARLVKTSAELRPAIPSSTASGPRFQRLTTVYYYEECLNKWLRNRKKLSK